MMKRLLPVWLLMLFALLTPGVAQMQDEPTSDFPEPGVYDVTDLFEGADRTYRVYIPESYDPEQATPLVIVLHGAGGIGAGIERFSGYSDLAEEEGFLVVYPDGINGVWNDGRIDPDLFNINDVGFLQLIIEFMTANTNVDTQRVYIIGYSMGGMLAIRAGCELGDQIAAVGTAAATMPVFLIPTCREADPFPLMMMHGSADEIVPAQGIENGYLSSFNSVDFWVEQNLCASDTGDILENINEVGDDGTSLERLTFTACAPNVEFVYFNIDGGGHTWPGREIVAPIPLGLTTAEVDATTTLWDFVSRFTLDGMVDEAEADTPEATEEDGDESEGDEG